MAINRQEVEGETRRMIANKTWKGRLIQGLVALFLAGLISSPVFTLVRALLEVLLGAGGIVLIGWALYQWYLLQEKH